MSITKTPSYPPPCPHLSSLLSTSPNLLLLHKQPPHSPPLCPLCPLSSPLPSLLFSCLSCPHTLLCPLHLISHPHPIFLNPQTHQLFCSLCRDQIYHPLLDLSHFLSRKKLTPHPTTTSETELPCPIKRPRLAHFRPWTPQLTPEDSLFPDIAKDLLPLGLRGMHNMGNTCFMNSVLQAMVHNPLVRNYFLSDRHNRGICERRRKKKELKSVVDVCLGCEMDDLFAAVFSGDRKPFTPAKFLYSWWQYASDLANYQQHDAHEFFICMLDGIHEKEQGLCKTSKHVSSGVCCIAHKVFSGTLRSDVTCTVCGYTSTTYDPCVDISLDLDYRQGCGKTDNHKLHGNGETKLTSGSQTCRTSTLGQCLERFTRPEKLGADQKFFCQQCQVRQESLKQMSIRKIPLVTCFHIKRFEHSPMRNMSVKVDQYLHFPFTLDLSPYLSSSILRARYGNIVFSLDSDDSNASVEVPSGLELFAVVTHTGKLDAGHYLTYLRLNNQWYRCDDSWVTHVGENIVRTSQAYMLFYVQKVLNYRASENATVS